MYTYFEWKQSGEIKPAPRPAIRRSKQHIPTFSEAVQRSLETLGLGLVVLPSSYSRAGVGEIVTLLRTAGSSHPQFRFPTVLSAVE